MFGRRAVRASADPAQSGEWGSAPQPGTPPRGLLNERLLWLGFDRSTLVNDARWVQQATSMEVQVVTHIDQARNACKRAAPLVCIVEFELSHGENGVNALELLRGDGTLAPAVLLTGAPELALAALERSRLLEAVPVISRAERHSRLREWLDEVRICLALPA
jgi:hypothetical protein